MKTQRYRGCVPLPQPIVNGCIDHQFFRKISCVGEVNFGRSISTKNMIPTRIMIPNALSRKNIPSVGLMADLVRNCMESRSTCCGNYESADPDSTTDSCEFVENSAKDIFSKTLDEWKYQYEFLVYQDINIPKIKIGNKCAGEKKSESYSISSGSGTIYLKLDICG